MVDFVRSRSRTIGSWVTTAIIAADSVGPLAKRRATHRVRPGRWSTSCKGGSR